MSAKNSYKKIKNYCDLVECDFEKIVSDKIEGLMNLKPESYGNSSQDFQFLDDVFSSQSQLSNLKEAFNQNQPLWLHKLLYATFWHNLLATPSRYLYSFYRTDYIKNVKCNGLSIRSIIDNLDWKTMIDKKCFYLPLDAKSKTRWDNKRIHIGDVDTYASKVEVVFPFKMETFSECLYNNEPFDLVFGKYCTTLRRSSAEIPTKDFLYHEFQGKVQFKF